MRHNTQASLRSTSVNLFGKNDTFVTKPDTIIQIADELGYR